jgi:hypothetical protein
MNPTRIFSSAKVLPPASGYAAILCGAPPFIIAAPFSAMMIVIRHFSLLAGRNSHPTAENHLAIVE